MRDPLRNIDDTKELTTPEEKKIWVENNRYCQVFCLICGQQYITRIRWDSTSEPLSPRCPKCNSFSWGESIPKTKHECGDGKCHIETVDIHSEEELLKRFMIQEDYSHYFDEEDEE